MTIGSAEQLLTLLTIGGVLLGALLWLIRSQVTAAQQLRPNGGSSLYDAVSRVESRLATADERLADVERFLRDHTAQQGAQISALHDRLHDHMTDHQKGTP